MSYEAHGPLAIRVLQQLATKTRQRFEQLFRIVILHRLGRVPVQQASVVIAVSSVHRREALEAVEWLIDELKARAPIWKLEEYEDGGSAWKENGPGCCNHGRPGKKKITADI